MIPRFASLLLLSIASLTLSGCVAGLIPLAAAGAIGKSQMDRRSEAGLIAADTHMATALPSGNVTITHVTSSETVVPGTGKAQAFQGETVVVEADAANSAAIQALSKQYAALRVGNPATAIGPYADLARFALAEQARMQAGEDISSAVLVPRVSLTSPQSMGCIGKDPAVIIDLDAAQGSYALPASLTDNAPVIATALNSLRAAEITIIWLSERDAGEAAILQQQLRDRDLLPAGVGDFLSLNRGPDDRKQLRRWETAELYCILAVAGDERGDFDELYDYLLKPEYAIALEKKFGAGWFVTPQAQPRLSSYSDKQEED